MGQQNQKSAPESQTESGQGFYLYCVGEQDALASLPVKDVPPPIEADTRFEIIEGSGLSAVTSVVELADYGEDALQEHLSDATWVAVRAMRHERVVEYFARRASVAPVRFGAIYLERKSIEAMLAEERDSLLSVIERLRGREEWGLNVYCDRVKLLENIESLSPRLREMSERAGAAPPGQAYLLRKKIEALREGEARSEVKGMDAKIENELTGSADAMARLRVLKDEAGEHGDLVAKLAFLVGRDRFADFRAAAERLAGEYAGAGFRLELTGPWPPYNFAAAE